MVKGEEKRDEEEGAEPGGYSREKKLSSMNSLLFSSKMNWSPASECPSLVVSGINSTPLTPLSLPSHLHGEVTAGCVCPETLLLPVWRRAELRAWQ